MNRRNFLEVCSVATLAGLLPRLHAQPTHPMDGVISVVSYGADPTGTNESSGAVRRAIFDLKPEGAVLDFPKGIYRFAEDEGTAIYLKQLKNLKIRGNGSLLIFAGSTHPFTIESCEGISISDLSIDWDILPFSQGTISEVGVKTFVLDIDPGYEEAAKRPIQAIGTYNRATRWPMTNGVDSYKSVASTELIAPGKVRVNLKSQINYVQGSTVVMRHNVYGVPGIFLNRCSQIEISNVSIYAMPGMGFVATRCTDITLDRFRTIIKPGTDRLMSICADGVHLSDCIGKINITGCSFQGMGDDAINICSSYYILSKVIGPRTVFLQNKDKTALYLWRLPQVGEEVEIVVRKTLKLLGMAKVVAVTLPAGKDLGAQLVLDRDLPSNVESGCILGCTQNTTFTTIRNSSFLGNRARGVLIHRNAEITGNTFAGNSLAAILLAADGEWLEGPLVKDVSITHNTFSNSYYAHPNDRRGTITIDTAHDRPTLLTPPEVVYQNVTIADNGFLSSPGAAVYCGGLKDLIIKSNALGKTNTLGDASDTTGAIVLRNVSQAVIQGNRAPVASQIRLIDCPEPLQIDHNSRLTVIGGTAVH